MKKTICLFLCILAVTCVLTLWAAADSTAEYAVREDSAMLNLVIQKGEYSNSPDVLVGSASEVVSKGKGTVTLEKIINIPDTKALQVFTPLAIPGQTRTLIVDMKFYKVVK